MKYLGAIFCFSFFYCAIRGPADAPCWVSFFVKCWRDGAFYCKYFHPENSQYFFTTAFAFLFRQIPSNKPALGYRAILVFFHIYIKSSRSHGRWLTNLQGWEFKSKVSYFKLLHYMHVWRYFPSNFEMLHFKCLIFLDFLDPTVILTLQHIISTTWQSSEQLWQ